MEVDDARLELPKAAEKELTEFVNWLMNAVREARSAAEAGKQAHSQSVSLTTELERLATLHRNGVLSDDEFEAVKKKLLGT